MRSSTALVAFGLAMSQSESPVRALANPAGPDSSQDRLEFVVDAEG
jgi:hypothetical protein